MRHSTQPVSTAAAPFSVLQAEILRNPTPLRAAITSAYRRDESEAVQWLLSQVQSSTASQATTQTLARKLVQSVRDKRTRSSGVDALMHEFSLSSEEGVALMCLAEALLRIPDSQTADRLIADKISKGDWRKHLGESPSLFVNAATWGLLVTGKLVGTSSEQGLGSALTKLIAKGGEPLIRKGVDLAMRMLGNQFVTGQTIDEALKNGRSNEERGYRYSYDMLGEAALTEKDAANYYASYETAIHAIGRASNGRGIKDGPGISVKLSALHPRYSRAQRERTMSELLPRLKSLLLLAKQYNIGLNIDAEETDRLELSLDMMEALAFDADLAGFDGIGFVVQAYQKRCPFVIDYLIDLARRSNRKFMVRLVKGAYWDAEIKRAQVDGMKDYPVYTRKVYTYVSYLACAQRLLASTDVIYPQFATHNALSLSTIYTWAQEMKVTDYEFQCLHGMGETLYDQVVGKDNLDKPCRIYAPVGSHETLLAYLVRRLLENGANSSFVNQIVDENVSIDSLITDPLLTSKQLSGAPHANIALPLDLFGTERRNSAGVDLSNENTLRDISATLAQFGAHQWQATPLLAGDAGEMKHRVVIRLRIQAGVVAKRTLATALPRLHIPFEHDVRAGRHFEIDRHARHELDSAPRQKSGEQQFVEPFGHRRGRAVRQHRLWAESHGDFEPLAEPLRHTVMLRAILVPLPVHPRRPSVEHLHAIGADVAHAGLRILCEHERKRDEGTAVFGPAGQDRQVVERAVTLHDLLARRVLHRLGHEIAEPPDHGQHLQRIHDPFGHVGCHQAVDLCGEIVKRLHAEREAHALHRSVDVRRDGHVEAGWLFKEERGTAARRLARTVDHGRDLEVRADGLGHARQQLAAFEISEKVVQVGIQIQAVILSAIRWASARARRPSWPVTVGGRRILIASTKSASSRLSGSSFSTVTSPPSIAGTGPSPLTSRNTSSFWAE